MVIGDASTWDDLFPWHLLPRIFDLVTETWESFDKPARDAHETAISKRFRTALKQAKDYKRLPFYIMREDVEDDFETGEELGARTWHSIRLRNRPGRRSTLSSSARG